MFGMFINTLNEERAAPSFLHCSAAAGGPTAPLQVAPGPPASLPSDSPPGQCDGTRSQSRGRSCPPRPPEREVEPREGKWHVRWEGKSQLFLHVAPGSPSE